MIKPGTIKSVLILVFIGMTLIGLVQPIAGNTTGQDSSQSGQCSSCNECNDSSQKGQYSFCDKYNCSNMDSGNKSRLNQTEMEYADYWLKKAMMMHYMHMKNPSTATNESQMEMMHCMINACEYMTGEKMTLDMMDKMACDGAEGWTNATKCNESKGWMNATACDKSDEWMNTLVDKGSTCNGSYDNESCNSGSCDSESCDNGSANDESAGCQ